MALLRRLLYPRVSQDGADGSGPTPSAEPRCLRRQWFAIIGRAAGAGPAGAAIRL